MAGIDGAAGAERQRVVLREGAFAVGRRHHRRVEQIGQRQQLVAGFGVEHAVAGDDHRRLRRDQEARRLVDVVRVAGRAGAANGAVIDLVAGELGGHHIGRHLDHDRAGAAVFQRIEGAPHRRHSVLRHVDRLDLLRDAGVGARRIEQREHLRRLARMAERQEQDRGRVGIGRGDAGKGILGARPVLHREDAGRIAVRDAGAAVGHVDADPLLAADHRPHPGVDGGLDDRRRRKAEQRRDALALQDLGDRVHDQHRRGSPNSGINAEPSA